jgi:hypothetical protein
MTYFAHLVSGCKVAAGVVDTNTEAEDQKVEEVSLRIQQEGEEGQLVEEAAHTWVVELEAEVGSM